MSLLECYTLEPATFFWKRPQSVARRKPGGASAHITIAITWEKWNLWSLNPMRARKSVSRPKSGSTSKRMSLSRERKIRIGIKSLDRFFSRMRANARKLDRDERPAPGLNLSFEDPADFLEVITPARVRLLQEITQKAVPLFALAAALSRDESRCVHRARGDGVKSPRRARAGRCDHRTAIRQRRRG